MNNPTAVAALSTWKQHLHQQLCVAACCTVASNNTGLLGDVGACLSWLASLFQVSTGHARLISGLYYWDDSLGIVTVYAAPARRPSPYQRLRRSNHNQATTMHSPTARRKENFITLWELGLGLWRSFLSLSLPTHCQWLSEPYRVSEGPSQWIRIMWWSSLFAIMP